RVLVPVHGEVRSDVGLLGSPSFEIPRMVDRDREAVASLTEEARKKGLSAKNRYNLITSLGLLWVYWFYFFTLIAFSDFTVLLYVERGLLPWVVAFVGYCIFT